MMEASAVDHADQQKPGMVAPDSQPAMSGSTGLCNGAPRNLAGDQLRRYTKGRRGKPVGIFWHQRSLARETFAVSGHRRQLVDRRPNDRISPACRPDIAGRREGGPMTAPRRRWSFSLRTLFVVVIGIAGDARLVGPPISSTGLRERHSALRHAAGVEMYWLGNLARRHADKSRPLPLRLGEPGRALNCRLGRSVKCDRPIQSIVPGSTRDAVASGSSAGGDCRRGLGRGIGERKIRPLAQPDRP